MSRCNSCGNSFEEDNGWQEYCCEECLMEMMTRDLKGKKLADAKRKFTEFITNPKTRRLVRIGGKHATPPTFGKQSFYLTEETINGRKYTFHHDVIMKPRPLTDDEKMSIVKNRGRGGFSDGHSINVCADFIPSISNRVGFGWFPHDE